MRLAVLLLLAIPAYAAAQPSPAPSVLKLPHPLPAPVAPHATKPTPAKPTEPKTSDHKQPNHKQPDHKPAAKPADHKPAPKPVHKPAALAPHPAAPAPAPTPAPEETAPAEPNKGSNTGLPLPRFAALRSDDVNFRSGPGTRYPIDWVYKRRDLPVRIEREFEIYRLVEDPFGNKGWVNAATLTGRRTAIVVGTERVLSQAASDTAGPVAKLKAGVILRLRACEANSEWCQAQIGDYRGYIKRSQIWGVLPGEVIQ